MDTILKTEGGSFFDWRDAARERGCTEEQIRAEEAARDERYAAQNFFRGKDDCGNASGRRVRSRTWGKCDENIAKQKNRIAIISGYFLRAFKNEFMNPTWGVGTRREKSLRGLYRDATLRRDGSPCGLFEATSRTTRHRDFAAVLEWCRNTIRGWVARGEWMENKAAIALRWLGGNPDEAMEFPTGTFFALKKMWAMQHGGEHKAVFNRFSHGPVSKSYSHGAEACSQKEESCFTDVGARVCFYESKKHYNDETAPAEAGFSPLAPTPLVGAGAATDAGTPGSGKFFSDKGAVGVPKFSGKFPHRLWWQVKRWMPALKRLHEVFDGVEWSGACACAWLKACFVAGKRGADLFDLYESAIMKWHARQAEWRERDDALKPWGMFTELYRTAAGLPDFRRNF